ncbi:MAG: hypothetical protein OZSIB_1684 [Candidatus Ozemobacter sibiricus]|uniref:Uncharacterized protein n=1 Tax=Candidatus Ozemobacter sibiricus TaxID=2268124 RepID=A0A367ZJE6_9BACT|nr:MAG: hypothetical protein OZSIB_1684 [Candidatus Ozemobacter sibiricus]
MDRVDDGGSDLEGVHLLYSYTTNLILDRTEGRGQDTRSERPGKRNRKGTSRSPSWENGLSLAMESGRATLMGIGSF